MKWIGKYNFIDLYKKNINKGNFGPETGLKLNLFRFATENIILLAGSKDLHAFYNKTGESAVVFISKNTGKSYEEIIFPEQNVTSLDTSEKFTLVMTNNDGFSTKGRNVLYLLNHETLKFDKIDEFSSTDKISYKQFNGEEAIYNNKDKFFLINLFTKVKTELPKDVTSNSFILDSFGSKITFLKDADKIVQYNCFTKSYKISTELKSNYSSILNTFGALYLNKINFTKSSGTIYDLDENELFKINPKEEKQFYRYKNFVCDYSRKSKYPKIKYSYDYGKTWKNYESKQFTIESSTYGFYKDKNIVVEGVFWHFDSPESGGRIMLGEFQK